GGRRPCPLGWGEGREAAAGQKEYDWSRHGETSHGNRDRGEPLGSPLRIIAALLRRRQGGAARRLLCGNVGERPPPGGSLNRRGRRISDADSEQAVVGRPDFAG